MDKSAADTPAESLQDSLLDNAAGPSTKGWLDSLTGGNQFMSAGLGVMAVGAGLAVLRQSVRRVAGFAKHQMLVTMEIPSKDKSYLWFLHWMSTYKSRRSHHFAVETLFKQHEGGKATTTFSLVPGPGKHLLRYKGAFIQVDRQRDGKMMDLSTGSPWETVTLTTLYRDRDIFRELLSEAQESAMKMQEGKTVVYTSMMTEWRPFGKPRSRRTLDSVVLDAGIKERVVSDVKDFIKSGQWYRDRGIPYRRGYLLHGPPGSGKTSFINALAGELEYNICTLSLSEIGMSDDRLKYLLSNVPERSIILMEDIDAAFTKRDKAQERAYKGSVVTFSGLLNALDGVTSAEELIIFMTTNHKDKLDDALIRPGRVDVQELLDNASDMQIRQMFLRFHEGEIEMAEQFLQNIRKSVRSISTAQLQGMFISKKAGPQYSVEQARTFKPEQVASLDESQ